jgi:hypothetical protein
LWRLLVGGPEDSRFAVQLLLGRENAAELVANAEAGLPILAEAIQPGGLGAVASMIARGVLIWGDTGRDGRQWQALTAEYAEALEEFPAEALYVALSEYRNQPDAKFYPLPGELRALAKVHATKMHLAHYRAKLLTEKKALAKQAPDDPEEKARQIALTQEFLAKLEQKDDRWRQDVPLDQLPRNRPPPPRQAPGIPTDSFGARVPRPGEMAEGRSITKVMAAMLARRAPEEPPEELAAPRYPTYEEFQEGARLPPAPADFEPTPEQLAEEFPF